VPSSINASEEVRCSWPCSWSPQRRRPGHPELEGRLRAVVPGAGLDQRHLTNLYSTTTGTGGTQTLAVTEPAALCRRSVRKRAPKALALVDPTMHHANHPRVVAGEPLRGCLAGSRMK
jgi:hypothetical protein